MSLFNLIIISFFSVLIGYLFLITPEKFIYAFLLIKPAIDREYSTIGRALSYAGAIAIPIFTFLYSLNKRKQKTHSSFVIIIVLLISLYIFSFLRFGNYNISTFAMYLRIILPFLLFYSIPAIIDNDKSIIGLFKISSFSGLVTAILILFQKIGFINPDSKKEIFKVGGEELVRYTGGYFDAFSAALPLMVAIICTLFLLQYSKNNKFFILFFLYFFSMIFVVHRMSVLVLAVILFIWVVLNKKYKIGLGIGIIVCIFYSFIISFSTDFYRDLYFFDKDKTVSTIQEDKFGLAKGALHGRGGVWEHFIEIYMDSPAFEKLFGILTPGRAPHNDYLCVLLNVGLIGLIMHLFIYFLLGFRLLRVFLLARAKSDHFLEQLSLTAIFFWVFFILGGMTLAVGLLSTLMWYVWIFAGLTIYQAKVRLAKSDGHIIIKMINPNVK